MAQFFAIVKLVLELFPLIIQFVTSIEGAFTQNGIGASKLDLLKGILQSAYSSMQDISVSFDQAWPALSATISGVVALFNKIGAFSKPSA